MYGVSELFAPYLNEARQVGAAGFDQDSPMALASTYIAWQQ